MSGAMADMWNNEQRGVAIAIFSSVNFIGPVAGPIVGSVMVGKYNWRSIEWLVCAYALTMTILDGLFIRETYAAVILQRRAVKMRHDTGDERFVAELERKSLTFSYVLQNYFSRPLKMLAMDPISQCFALFTAFSFGILYLTFVAYPVEYSDVRGWSKVESALPNIGVIIGVLFGLSACIWYQPRYNEALKKNDGQPVPEMRLPLLVVGAAVFPVGLFIFAMTSGKDVHWIGGVIGITLVGFGIYMIFFPSLNYIVDTYLQYTASAVAANTLLRSVFGAAFLFLKYGEKIRQKSKFAPTD
ncbi:protein of unknown function [Taphrina deformans PYCC 5710]|uniref:Major facilitator superfamily (MFS) profile domain-containing protein n=1 Tax=Taphrina deformans (strain PYCC 5710 / ATCC 11124 / CBS 356.35 / IMI 108563 / JCM 9778 / NBRC 8474) TaxID=1097556 RepID=R4XNC5_TAPDE|nr:protein of unknown function [Taphrina deformans PYCC 5710]|eukprot:CCG84744.1 protein of unknown function [Taphrina deformans PYCC 5710]